MDERFQRCLTREPSYLVSLRSSWDSNRALFDWHPCGRRSPLCCSWSLCLVAGSRRKRMDPERRCRSSCPSRLSRLHLWLWQSRMRRYRVHHKAKPKRRWTPASIASHSRLVSSLSCQGCQDSCWGSLARQRHLWERVSDNIEFKKMLPNLSPPLTLGATAFCRAKWMMPKSGSSCWVEYTSKTEPRWIWALAAAALITITNVSIFAVFSLQVCAGAARGGKTTLW